MNRRGSGRGKPKPPTAAEVRQRIAEMPDTRLLFERASAEPYVLQLKVTDAGIRIEFQALHPKHALALLDALNALRAPSDRDAVARQEEP